MSEEQNLSPPPSPPVNSPVTSLPRLPDDFLSFQPQPSTHNSIDVDSNVPENNSLDNRNQEQQQGSYRRGGNYYNRGREYYNYNDNNTRSYRGQKRRVYNGGYQQDYDRNYSSTRNFGFGGGDGGGGRGGRGGRNGGYGTPSSSKGGQQKRGNNSKKLKPNEQNIDDIDISKYYKKSFLEDPWAHLMKE